jgi:hypothetical protein
MSDVCLHKDEGAYETRVGFCCPRCGMIRHRHSELVLVPIQTIGGITLSTDVAVPIRRDLVGGEDKQQ